MADEPGPMERAEALRGALVDYVRAVHTAYLEVAEGRSAEPGALPLGGAPFSVAVAAADQLHLLATRDRLPPLRAHEEPIADAVGPLRWEVRFLDVSVLPELAGAADGSDVRRILGVSTSLYHLVVNLAGSLDGHQAVHAGTGLANAHLAGG
jgi:hypothetical protein